MVSDLKQLFTNAGLEEQSLNEDIAYHGSPVDFDEFSLKYIGNGEGAQAHGWGLYFTLDKNVALGYKHRLSVYTKNKKTLERWQLELLDLIHKDGYDNVIKDLKDVIEKVEQAEMDENDKDEMLQEFKRDISFLESIAGTEDGTLFIVDIPDNDLLMDETLPITKQPEKVKNILIPLLKEHLSKYFYQMDFRKLEDIIYQIKEEFIAKNKFSEEELDKLDYVFRVIENTIQHKQIKFPKSLFVILKSLFEDRIELANDKIHTSEDVDFNKSMQIRIKIDTFVLNNLQNIINMMTTNNEFVFYINKFDEKITYLTGKELYRMLLQLFNYNAPVKASMLLLKNGIQGIKYDGFIDKECVVIFNPKRVKILSKE